MLHSEAVNREALGLLKELVKVPALKGFFLVGGTALALRRGHRISVDIDLFTLAEFDSGQLSEALSKVFAMEEVSLNKNSLSARIKQTKTDLIRHGYPLLKQVEAIDGIPVLSLEDIAAMKINSASSRGSKKDFYDLFELLSVFSLSQMIDCALTKYKEISRIGILKSLVYFDDAEEEPDPVTLNNTIWEAVKKRMVSEIGKIN